MDTERDGSGSPQENAPAPARRRRVLLRLLIVVFLAYLGVCVLIAALQSKLLYFPAREYTTTPADAGLAYDDLTLTTRDGVSIAAWYVPCPSAKGSLIFCHGNAGNISDQWYALQRLHEMGVNVLALDYRGFGRSDGKPSEAGTYEDADAAWRYLVDTRGESPDRIILFGRSLGGAIAIELAVRHAPAALIVESSFTNIVDIGRLHFPLLPVRWIVTYRYDSIEKVPRIHCPKLFLHGRGDTLIPFDNGQALYNAAAAPKTFIETPGDHGVAGFTYSRHYTRRVAAFIAGVLGAPD